MTVEAVISTLVTLEKMHKSLLELAFRKTEYIKAGQMEQLDELLKNEQSHVAAIEKLEIQRQTAVAAYFKHRGTVQSAQLSIADVIDSIEESVQRQQLIQIRANFIDLLGKLKAQNELNQKLVFQSLQFVNLSLEMMRPAPPQTETMNYSGQEVLGQNQVRKKSYFDSQA